MDINQSDVSGYKSHNIKTKPYITDSSAMTAKANQDSPANSPTVSIFKEGQTLQGEIIDIRYNEVKLRLEPDGQVISARLDNNVELTIGGHSRFEVVEAQTNQLRLKLIQDENSLFNETTIDKALNASALPLSDKNRAIVQELLNHNMPIDKQTLKLMVRLSNIYKDTDLTTLVLMHKHNIPIHEANVRQFEAYVKGEHQLLNQIQPLTDALSNLLQGKADSNADATVNVHNQLLKLLAAKAQSSQSTNTSIPIEDNTQSAYTALPSQSAPIPLEKPVGLTIPNSPAQSLQQRLQGAPINSEAPLSPGIQGLINSQKILSLNGSGFPALFNNPNTPIMPLNMSTPIAQASYTLNNSATNDTPDNIVNQDTLISKDSIIANNSSTQQDAIISNDSPAQQETIITNNSPNQQEAIITNDSPNQQDSIITNGYPLQQDGIISNGSDAQQNISVIYNAVDGTTIDDSSASQDNQAIQEPSTPINMNSNSQEIFGQQLPTDAQSNISNTINVNSTAYEPNLTINNILKNNEWENIINIIDTENIQLSQIMKEQLIEGSLTAPDFFNLLQNNAALLNKEVITSLLKLPEYQKLIKHALRDKWSIKPNQINKEAFINNFYKGLNDDIEALQRLIKNSQAQSDTASVQEATKKLQDNLNFMKDLNEVFNYLQLPINLKEQDVHGELYVFSKKNKARTNKDELSVLLHLDMPNLGQTDIHITLNQSNINANFYLEDASVRSLIQEHITDLDDALNNKGYKLHAQVKEQYKKLDFSKDFIEQDSQDNLVKRFTFDIRT